MAFRSTPPPHGENPHNQNCFGKPVCPQQSSTAPLWKSIPLEHCFENGFQSDFARLQTSDTGIDQPPRKPGRLKIHRNTLRRGWHLWSSPLPETKSVAIRNLTDCLQTKMGGSFFRFSIWGKQVFNNGFFSR